MDESTIPQQHDQEQDPIAESVISEELAALVEEIEAHLQRYLQRSLEEYPPGSQADWVASTVVERVMSGGSQADFKSLAKLCVFLVESLGDISKTYEEFYSEQLDTLKEQSVQQATQLVSLEEENTRLRERLHSQAEELKIRELSLRSLRLQQRSSSARPSNKESLSSSHNSGRLSARPEQLLASLQEAVTEKSAAIQCLEQQLHAEKMKNREFDEKVSLEDDDEDEREAPDEDYEHDDEDDDDDDFNVSGSADDFLDSSMGFDRELVRENAELQSRMTELMRENNQYRQLGAQLTLENQQLRTATRELRSAVERLHGRLHSDDLLNSAASKIFEELSLLRGGEVRSDAERAAADARAADESFDVDGEPEEIPDDANGATATTDSAAACRECRQCGRLRESIAKLELRHEEEAARIREIVTQNVCMKAELEDWKADMAEKVRQNVALNGQLESCQRLLSRLSPGNADKARSVFGRVLIDKKGK